MGGKDKNADGQQMEVGEFTGVMMTIFFTALSLALLFPILLILVNVSRNKPYISDAPFRFPMAEAYVGLGNYIEGVRKTGFFMAFGCPLFITVYSMAVIVLFTPMTVWYITRVRTKLYSVPYYVFVFVMIMPFQMVMFTISKTANDLYLNSIYGPILLYLGFDAGQAVFLFCRFVEAIPLEIEEAAMIDGCSPVQIYSHVVFPILRPTAITAAILDAIWVWNDYLLPSLILPQEKNAMPMVIQNLKDGYGSIDMGAMMTILVLAIVPIIVSYLGCQEYIVKGVATGTVKG